MRQNNRMCLGMWQLECPADDMTELVMNPHGRRCQGQPAHESPVKRRAALVIIGAAVTDSREPGGKRPDALFGNHRQHRVPVLRIQRLHRVRHGVDRTGTGKLARQAAGEVRVVNHRLWDNNSIATGDLPLPFGNPPDIRHLRTGIGRWHRNDRQTGLQRNSLRNPDGRTAADSNDTIAAVLPHQLHSTDDVLARDMHHCTVDTGSERRSQGRYRRIGNAPLRACRNNEDGAGVQFLYFGRQF